MDGRKASKWVTDWRRDLLNELKRGAKANTIHNDRECGRRFEDYTVWQPYKFPMSY